MQETPGCKPNGSRHDTWPKGQKWWCSTKTDSESPIVSMIPIDSEWIYTWDQFHWKFYHLTFLTSTRMPQPHQLGINFKVDIFRTSWALDIETVLAILVESDFCLTWDQFHWKFCLILFLCTCRTYKSDFVCILYINLKVRWSWILSWTWSQTLKFQIGLDLHLDVHVSLPQQHPPIVPFVLLIISMVPNNN
jgi:hypothetical protein